MFIERALLRSVERTLGPRKLYGSYMGLALMSSILHKKFVAPIFSWRSEIVNNACFTAHMQMILVVKTQEI